MTSDYDRFRHLLLQDEVDQLGDLHEEMGDVQARLSRIGDLLADELERAPLSGTSRLTGVLSDLTADSLEIAVRRRPQSVVEAVYPIIGPAIRRSLGEALRQVGDDLDRVLGAKFGPRTLWWRIQSWRTGVPYAQLVLRHSTRYQVEHLFLIQRKSGLLLGHLTADGLPGLDADAVAGMFSAIHHFVEDSVSAGGDAKGHGLGAATVGDYRLVVSEGPWCLLVAFVRGTPASGFSVRLDELNESLHRRHGLELDDPGQAGQMGEGRLVQAYMDQLHPDRSETAAESPRSRRRRWFIYGLLIAFVAFFVVNGVIRHEWNNEAKRIRTRLDSLPGFSILSWDASHRGHLRIEGWLDPLADDPAEWLARTSPDVKAEWHLRPFESLEPTVVQRRVAQDLGVPTSVVQVSGSTEEIALVGSVPFVDWDRVMRTGRSMPGVLLDTTALDYPGKAEIDRLTHEVEKVQIDFDSGTVQPVNGMDERVGDLIASLRHLQDVGAAHGVAFHLVARGTTDEPGTYAQNRDLRVRRAEWLATRLMHELVAPSTITLDQAGMSVLPYRGDLRSTSLAVTPFPVSL